MVSHTRCLMASSSVQFVITTFSQTDESILPKRVAVRRKVKRRLLNSPAPTTPTVNGCSVDGGSAPTPHINRTSIDNRIYTPICTETLQETNSVIQRRSYCPGADLTKRKQRVKGKPNKVQPTNCKYCYNAHDIPKRNTTTWMCSLCKVPLCVGCNYRYHRWVRSAHL